MQVVLCWLVFFGLLYSDIAFAGLPLPRGSQLIRKEIVETDGKEKMFNFYETRLRADEVMSFYKRELTRRGYNLFIEGNNNAIFLKGEEMFMVVVTPGTAGKTQFITTTASTDISIKPQEVVCEDIPSVPVYPGARCMRSMKMGSGKVRSVSYLTKDTVEDALNFYRFNMPGVLWNLEGEMDLGSILSESMPSEDEIGIDLGLSSARQIIFKNSKGASCIISVMNSPVGRSTLINITYDEEPEQ